MRSSVAVRATRTCVRARGAVEVTGGDEDPALGEPAQRLPARLVAGGPQVEAGLGVVDPEARAQHRFAQDVATARVRLPAGPRRARRRRGRPPPRPARERERAARGACAAARISPTRAGVTDDEPGPVAGQVGPLRQRVHREQALDRSARHRRVQDGDRVGVPRRARRSTRRRRRRRRARGPTPRPWRGARRAAPGRWGSTGSSPTPAATRAGPTDVSESVATTCAPTRWAPDGVGRVGQLGHDDDVGRGRARAAWAARPTSSLLPMVGRTCGRGVDAGDAEPTLQPGGGSRTQGTSVPRAVG